MVESTHTHSSIPAQQLNRHGPDVLVQGFMPVSAHCVAVVNKCQWWRQRLISGGKGVSGGGRNGGGGGSSGEEKLISIKIKKAAAVLLN